MTSGLLFAQLSYGDEELQRSEQPCHCPRVPPFVETMLPCGSDQPAVSFPGSKTEQRNSPKSQTPKVWVCSAETRRLSQVQLAQPHKGEAAKRREIPTATLQKGGPTEAAAT